MARYQCFRNMNPQRAEYRAPGGTRHNGRISIEHVAEPRLKRLSTIHRSRRRTTPVPKSGRGAGAAEQPPRRLLRWADEPAPQRRSERLILATLSHEEEMGRPFPCDVIVHN